MAQWPCPVSTPVATHSATLLRLWHALGTVLLWLSSISAQPAQLMDTVVPVCQHCCLRTQLLGLNSGPGESF